MPELPDVEAYLRALRPRVLEQQIEAIRLQSPFLLRTVEPRLEQAVGLRFWTFGGWESGSRWGWRASFGW